MGNTATTDAATVDIESHRGELTGYCYRMLGSAHDADDAVQDTMVRAWQGLDRFEGRSALRSWLYRIATNVCLDMLRSRKRRALPMDLSAPVPATTAPVATLPETAWIGPIPAGEVTPAGLDPAAQAELQDTIRLAFIAALQHLPPRQRAVLILRDVLCWQASEVAGLLDSSVASVNSALQRARARLAATDHDTGPSWPQLADEDRDLLTRYVDAFERYDIDGLVSLLHEDASISMPPYQMWLRGRADLRGWYLGYGSGCRGSRLVPTVANGAPAFGHYSPTGSHDAALRGEADPGPPAGGPDGGEPPSGKHRWEPWCLQVLELSADRVQHIHHFLDTSVFPRFGLPPYLED